MVEWKKLGEICYISDYVSNGSFASLRDNVQYKSEPDYAILVRFAYYSNGFDTSKFVYIDEHAYHFLSKSYLEGGEIIMSNVGSCGLLFRCPKLDRKMSLAPNSILIKSEFIDYLYYWLGGNVGQEEIRKITSKSAMPKFNKTEFKKIQVPIPSIEEQNRIVGILDTFTASIENLKEQITQRRKQYEHYRDQLLDLEGKEGVEIKTLGTICHIGDGLHGTPEYDENGDYFFINGNNLSNGHIILKSDTKRVNEEMFAKYGIELNTTSILMSINGTIGNIAFYHNERIVLGKSAAYFQVRKKDILDYKYLYFYLQTQKANDYYQSMLTGSTIKNLGLKALRTFEIPIPSLPEQSRIVSILDTFEASIANLEAQLSQREKQYEYYRNKLLTFE